MIFVPMLLRGPVENRVVEVPVEIPPKPFEVVGQKRPDQSAEKIIATIPEPSGRRPVISEEEPTSRSMPSKITKAATSASVASKAATSASVASNAKEKAKTDKKPQPDVVKKQEKPVLLTESKKNIVELAWVVQVGSFSNSRNALALRDKLRSKGYRTFVESIETDAGKMYRVRVGPELDKSKIESAQKKLKEQEKLSGRIYKHGN